VRPDLFQDLAHLVACQNATRFFTRGENFNPANIAAQRISRSEKYCNITCFATAVDRLTERWRRRTAQRQALLEAPT
jgi:hypothetical protein